MPTRYTEAEMREILKEVRMKERTAKILARITHWVVGIIVGSTVVTSVFWAVLCLVRGC